jgi:NitT/TauT family transport system substrate-binding protein
MRSTPNRRRFLSTLSSTGVAALFGSVNSSAQEAPPETTNIRLLKIPGICIAPQYVAEELLHAEGFTTVQFIEVPLSQQWAALAAGNLDMTMSFIAPYIVQIDVGLPLVLLGGIHAGCFELFGTERVKAIRDLKGKTVAVPELGSPHHLFVAAMASHVGIDSNRDINFIAHPVSDSIELLAGGKVDALMGFPPVPQELRDKQIGRVIVSSGLDRPWSQYFCCIVVTPWEFVHKHPVATKRALRAILKATHFCAVEPERAARLVADKGYSYDYSLQTMKEIAYARWRDYDTEDTIRFYSLRLHEAGMIKSTPNKIIAQGTDLRFFNELKRELKS